MPSAVVEFSLGATRMRGQRTSVASLPSTLTIPSAPSSGVGVVKYAVSASQADLLREIAAVSDAVHIPPPVHRSHGRWSSEG